MKAFCLIMTIILALVMIVMYLSPKWDYRYDRYYYDDNHKMGFYILIPSFIIFLLVTCLLFT